MITKARRTLVLIALAVLACAPFLSTGSLAAKASTAGSGPCAAQNASTSDGCAPAPVVAPDPTTPFATLDPAFSQSLFGSISSFLGGVAFAPNGDVWSDSCAFDSSPLFRFSTSTTSQQDGATLASVSTVPSNAGCGLTNNPDGFIYSNSDAGVSQIDASTGSALRTLGQPGNALGITTDPQSHRVVYVGQDCRFSPTCSIYSLDPSTNTTTTLAQLPSSQASFVDGLTFDPSGQFLFLSTRAPFFALTILTRKGAVAQQVPMSDEPDGIAFHAVSPQFVVTNDTDGNITRFAFPQTDYTQKPTVDSFASGGFRGDLLSVGADGCMYLTQDGTNFPDGTRSSADSIVRICPGFAPPPGVGANRQLVLVHGLMTSFGDVAEGNAFGDLITAAVNDGFPTPQVFRYYEDLGDSSVSSPCIGGPANSPGPNLGDTTDPDVNVGSLYLNSLWVGNNEQNNPICDGSGPIALNSTKLDDDLQQLTPAAPITLFGYSEGASTIRGTLTLSQSRNDSALANVDSVIFLDGVQQGSWLANLALGAYSGVSTIDSVPLVPQLIPQLDKVAQQLNMLVNRPAVYDLAAQSSWFDDVNPVAIPPSIHFFNFITDFQMNQHNCILFVCSDATMYFGDVVVKAGSDSPSDLRPLGGAGFLPFGDSAGQHEYVRNVFLNGGSGIEGIVSGLQDMLNSQAWHVAVQYSLGSLPLAPCDGSNRTNWTDALEMVRIMENPAGACG